MPTDQVNQRISGVDIEPESISNRDPNSNYGKLIRLWEKQVDELEVVFDDIRKTFAIDTARFGQLDQQGTILGPKRFGRSDREYRKILKLQQIAKNKSNLYATYEALKYLYDTEFVEYDDDYPAAVIFGLYGGRPITSLDILTIAQLFMSSGIKVSFIIVGGENPFTFAGSAGGGWGSVLDGDIGGRWVGILEI